MIKTLRTLVLASAFAGCSTLHVNAAVMPMNLGGNSSWENWTDLSSSANPGYGGFPGSSPWPGPILSQDGTTGHNAGLNKIANGSGGGPYPASGSIYYGGFSGDINNPGGILGVADSSPIANLQTIVFQIEIGEAWTFDFVDDELPVLYLNGGTTAITADYSSLFEQEYSGTITMPSGEEDLYYNTYALQWDLSGELDPITSFEIQWEGVQHAQLYELQLDQSDLAYATSTLPPSIVPEPTSAALLLSGGMLALFRRKRR